MSFLKIRDPKKRDLIVNEFLKTKKNIQDNFLSERLGDKRTKGTFEAVQTNYRVAKRNKRKFGSRAFADQGRLERTTRNSLSSSTSKL